MAKLYNVELKVAVSLFQPTVTSQVKLYVQCLDSNTSEDENAKYLRRIGLLRMGEQRPIIYANEPVPIPYDDDSVFAGFDILWLFESKSQVPPAPPFDLIPATYSLDAFAHTIVGDSFATWDEVSDWMDANRVLGVVATGYLTLAIW